MCSLLCDVLSTRRAKTASGRKGAGRSRSRRTCSRSGRSARRAGPNAAGVLVILSKHTSHTRFQLSLCQRNYEQVRLVHLIVIAVLVPPIQEQIDDVIKVIPEECMSKRTVQQIVDVPVPQIPLQIFEVIKGSSNATDPGADCGSDQ